MSLLEMLITAVLCYAISQVWVLGVSHEDLHTTRTTQKSSNATVPAPTDDPLHFVNYTLEISSSGPAVLDSTVRFTAILKDREGHLAQSKMFRYLWSNSADTSMKKTVDDYNASIEYRTSSDKDSPGQYLMTVIVYVKDTVPKKIVSYGSLQFDLTETLNGNLNFSQHLLYQRKNDTFSTGKTLSVFVNVTDRFPLKWYSPTIRFVYYWYQNNNFVIATNYPNYTVTPTKAGNLNLSTMVIATLPYYRMLHSNTSLLYSPVTCDLLRKYKKIVLHSIQDIFSLKKCGIMEQNVSIKESLKNLTIKGNKYHPLGEPVKINITCHGNSLSYPTAVCWNITNTNFSLPKGNASCKPSNFTNTCHHQVKIWLNKTGSHLIWFTVYNDVGFITGKHLVIVQNPGENSSSVLVVPVVFSMLGLMIIFAGVVFVLRLRKKPLVEVADFDFHPMLMQEESLLKRAKSVWSKARTMSSLPRYVAPRPRRYGSLMNETL